MRFVENPVAICQPIVKRPLTICYMVDCVPASVFNYLDFRLLPVHSLPIGASPLWLFWGIHLDCLFCQSHTFPFFSSLSLSLENSYTMPAASVRSVFISSWTHTTHGAVPPGTSSLWVLVTSMWFAFTGCHHLSLMYSTGHRYWLTKQDVPLT